MQQSQTRFTISTQGQALYEFTREVADWISDTGIETGLLTLFCRHTSASLLINENAAPAVKRDLLRWLSKAAPEGDTYEHDDEGPDDMPAHIRTMLTGASLSIPVADGRMVLGTWQGIYLAEHRAMPHRREIVAHLLGERVSEV
ncbi:secondary thiamine-phosphate synthase enzyme YjbQ [Aurantiacibacter sediminis]|uniref:YjbQ family protein n=1 Tax=Aurantiacibacter sediminis TaxID=2793064 RepID=A0ABS0N6T8_9SPHN|nr:secondary thiamine-phosphate synthase enzyme YjbQ [Aurantiacibacter sediminis]MBH5323498.1 YjbQ family protein [Aurantiacibacter sediminis]